MEKLRIDKWLFCARFYKSRSIATTMITNGKMRINSLAVKKPGYMIKVGDVLTFAKEDHIRVIEVVMLSDKRGPAPVARLLYNDLDPPQPKPKKPLSPAQREKGSGRPTKKERRETDHFRDFETKDL
jgi:ribosome-associated heat shock protein Hsp15